MFWTVLLATAAAETCPDAAVLSARLAGSDCPTLALQAAESEARAAGTMGCFEDSLAALQLGRAATIERAPPLPPGAGKGLRDAYRMSNSQESENFVLRWGSSKNLSSSRASVILDSFEEAWREILVDMDYNAPQGSESYKFNLYIGDTGGPRGYGSAYYSSDSQGYPMIVITQGTYDDAGFGAVVGAHEFYHALQGASGARYEYNDSSPGAWYWEATANWVVTEIYPEDRAQNVAGFLMGYAFFPHLPISYFDYADGSGGLLEYHQYGAFIFPYYLTREVADASLIRGSWLESDESDPLAALSAGLSSGWGLDLDEAFFDFAAWNATYQRYDDGDVFSLYIEQYEQYYGAKSQRIVASVGEDSDGWQAAPTQTLPRSYGTNFLLIEPGEGDATVSFEGDEGPIWDVRAVVVDGDSESEVAVPLDTGAGSVSVTGSGGADAVYLVVSAISSSSDRTSSFGWSYSVTSEPGGGVVDTGEPGDTGSGADTGGDEKTSRGGCAVSGGAPGLVLALLGLAGVRRRRR